MAASQNFRQNLRTALQVKEWSQRDLADKAETSNPYVNRVLQGKTSPSLEQCEKFANAVGYPLAALLGSTADFEAAVLTHAT